MEELEELLFTAMKAKCPSNPPGYLCEVCTADYVLRKKLLSHLVNERQAYLGDKDPEEYGFLKTVFERVAKDLVIPRH